MTLPPPPGAASLPHGIAGLKSGALSAAAVVQVASVRNLSAPPSSPTASSSPRLLKVVVSDGTNKVPSTPGATPAPQPGAVITRFVARSMICFTNSFPLPLFCRHRPASSR